MLLEYGSRTYSSIDLTSLVRHFCSSWEFASLTFQQDQHAEIHDQEFRSSESGREAVLYNLGHLKGYYETAREARDAAHPEAHLMLMLTVHGGWFARWRAELRGAAIWKNLVPQFDAEYARFQSYYAKKLRGNSEKTLN